MKNEFTDIMSQRTDEELINIVTSDRDSYQFEAIKAAEHEIEKRNIDDNKFTEIEAAITTDNQKQAKLNTKKVGVTLRLFNFIIDTTLIVLLSVAVLTIIGSLIVFYSEQQIAITTYVVYFSIFILYYVIMEKTSQKTIGKFITKTKVISKTGSKASFTEILARTVYRFVPFDGLSYIFVDNGLHDYLSGTTVVKSDFIGDSTENDSSVIDDFS